MAVKLNPVFPVTVPADEEATVTVMPPTVVLPAEPVGCGGIPINHY